MDTNDQKPVKPVLLTLKPRTSSDPLHGVTLEVILTRLVKEVGWEKMGAVIRIKCFRNDPSIKSSLVFLRRNPWARALVEKLYLRTCRTRCA